jgi:hypothetical protein
MSWRYVWLAVSVISFVNLFRILFQLVDIPTKVFSINFFKFLVGSQNNHDLELFCRCFPTRPN